MPTRAPTLMTASARATGFAMAERSCAARPATPPDPTTGTATAKCSPERRTTVAPGSASETRRRATSHSTWSPTSWPSASITSPSRSTTMTRTAVSDSTARAARSPTEPRNSSIVDSRTCRLGRPVNVSWVASHRSRSTRSVLRSRTTRCAASASARRTSSSVKRLPSPPRWSVTTTRPLPPKRSRSTTSASRAPVRRNQSCSCGSGVRAGTRPSVPAGGMTGSSSVRAGSWVLVCSWASPSRERHTSRAVSPRTSSRSPPSSSAARTSPPSCWVLTSTMARTRRWSSYRRRRTRWARHDTATPPTTRASSPRPRGPSSNRRTPRSPIDVDTATAPVTVTTAVRRASAPRGRPVPTVPSVRGRSRATTVMRTSTTASAT